MLTLTTMLARTERLYGARPAIIDVEGQFTWSEFINRIARCGHMLRRRGINAGDRFGRTVSVHGDRIVCGAPWYAAGCGGTNQCGSVFVFEHDGSDWMQTDRLVPDDLANSAVRIHRTA